MSESPSPSVVDAVTRAAGRAPADWTRSVGGGYTPAERWLVAFEDGERAFAKVGTIDRTAEWLRLEQRAYSEIHGAFLPRVLGWSDGPVPALLLEDLSEAIWPPPWEAELVERVLATLDRVAATPCPDWAAELVTQIWIFSGWSDVAADPGPFLSLGLVGSEWLEAALPALVETERPPRVRHIQLEQAKTALPWAARWLGLPPPDGPGLAVGV